MSTAWISKTTAPLRKIAHHAAFALLSVYFVIAGVAAIHFNENVAPLWKDASHIVSTRSGLVTRGLDRIQEKWTPIFRHRLG